MTGDRGNGEEEKEGGAGEGRGGKRQGDRGRRRKRRKETGRQGRGCRKETRGEGRDSSLVSVAGELRRGEHLFASHDDIYVMAQPDRVVDIHQTLAVHLWNEAKITLHQGKTVIWNRGGIPRGCHVLDVAARRADPSATVW